MPKMVNNRFKLRNSSFPYLGGASRRVRHQQWNTIAPRTY